MPTTEDPRKAGEAAHKTVTEVAQAVSDAFYKVDKARTREAGGHGLGLAMVKSIAELHNGDFGAENQKGGIEFFIAV